MGDASEAESRGTSSPPPSPLNLVKCSQTRENKNSNFPLALLHTQLKCGEHADLHKIIQVLLLRNRGNEEEVNCNGQV